MAGRQGQMGLPGGSLMTLVEVGAGTATAGAWICAEATETTTP
jgi:hypothetical protein